MEMLLNGSALRTFHRTITCLARIGSELVVQAFPSQLIFHTINTSRSAYQSITLKANFFDVYSLSATPPVQFSVLLKAVCSILRTPVAGVDRFSVNLPDADAAKVQFTLQCFNGVQKTYWITCNVEPDIQHLSLDRGKFPSSLVVRPRDLSRLLGNFQSSLQEITVIATEPTAPESNMGGEIGGKAVEIRSYIDPTKENSDTTLHTQLWIDPAEEFLQYKHRGDPVDVTFSVKELKAFLAFCEGCEVDIHLFFEKAGEPILMAPTFGIEDGSNSDFDATLVLATMLVSQLHDANNSEPPTPLAPEGLGSQLKRARIVDPSPTSDRPSDHTKIWSEISGCSSGRERQAHPERPFRENQPDVQQAVRGKQPDEHQDRREVSGNHWSQHHPCNWLDNGDDDEEDGEEEFVQPTPEH